MSREIPIPSGEKFSKADELISSQTIVGIDFLRGAFAVLVLFSHSLASTKTIVDRQGEIPGFLKVWTLLFSHGAIWVFGFFVVSGFCIQLSVNRSISRNGRFHSGRYLFARFTRIYPIYLIGLLLAAAVWCFGATLGSPIITQPFSWSALFSNLLLVQGFGESFDGYGQSWSITYEFAYYLMVPFLLLLTGCRPLRSLLCGVAGNLVLCAVVVTIWKVGNEQTDWLIPFWMIPAMSLLWFAGALLAQFWKQVKSTFFYRYSFLLMGLTLPVIYATYIWHIALATPAAIDVIHSYASVAAFVFMILATDRMKWLNRPRVASFCRWFGMLSYPLYLFHVPLQRGIEHIVTRFDLHWSITGYVVILFSVPLLINMLVGVGLERYWLGKRKQWTSNFVNREIRSIKESPVTEILPARSAGEG